MKLMWFHLMPYTELPENFRGKHPSVWIDIHASLFDPKCVHHWCSDFMTRLFADKVQSRLTSLFDRRKHRWWPRLVVSAQSSTLRATMAAE